ncbi:unnamed protein product, partial [Sphacelaria rigidula]
TQYTACPLRATSTHRYICYHCATVFQEMDPAEEPGSAVATARPSSDAEIAYDPALAAAAASAPPPMGMGRGRGRGRGGGGVAIAGIAELDASLGRPPAGGGG